MQGKAEEILQMGRQNIKGGVVFVCDMDKYIEMRLFCNVKCLANQFRPYLCLTLNTASCLGQGPVISLLGKVSLWDSHPQGEKTRFSPASSSWQYVLRSLR